MSEELTNQIAGETQNKLNAVRANIFGSAHAAIDDWSTFPWHRGSSGEIQTDKLQSSQALAVDVFGAIRAAPAVSRDAVLGALTSAAGLPAEGPWEIELEWCEPLNLLCEPRPTQVDVLATGRHAILVIECKFTESGGACSQTGKLRRGPSAGRPQCNGRYEPQTHPVSGVRGSCTLTGKGIRYWEVLPAVFALEPASTYAPCPFRKDSFQWMRNMVFAHELGRVERKASRCLIAYAGGRGFPTSDKMESEGWLPPLADGATAPFCSTYQAIVKLAAQADSRSIWTDLSTWIDAKISTVLDRTRCGPQSDYSSFS